MMCPMLRKKPRRAASTAAVASGPVETRAAAPWSIDARTCRKGTTAAMPAVCPLDCYRTLGGRSPAGRWPGSGRAGRRPGPGGEPLHPRRRDRHGDALGGLLVDAERDAVSRARRGHRTVGLPHRVRTWPLAAAPVGDGQRSVRRSVSAQSSTALSRVGEAEVGEGLQLLVRALLDGDEVVVGLRHGPDECWMAKTMTRVTQGPYRVQDDPLPARHPVPAPMASQTAMRVAVPRPARRESWPPRAGGAPGCCGCAGRGRVARPGLRRDESGGSVAGFDEAAAPGGVRRCAPAPRAAAGPGPAPRRTVRARSRPRRTPWRTLRACLQSAFCS